MKFNHRNYKNKLAWWYAERRRKAREAKENPSTPPMVAPATFGAGNFPYVPTIIRVGSGSSSTFSTNYSESARKALINPVTTFYVRKAGNNNNDGLTPATAFRSLRLAVRMGKDTLQAFKVNYEAALPGATPIVYKDSVTQARSGQPTNNATWGEAWRSEDLTVDCIFEPSIPGGVAYSILDRSSTAYTATADPNIYQSTQTGSRVFDFGNRDRNGAPRHLVYMTTTPADGNAPWPEMNALFNTYSGITDGGQVAAYNLGVCWRNTTSGVLYIRLADNRVPDSNVSIANTAQSGGSPGIASNTTVAPRCYMEGLRFVGAAGGGNPAFIWRGANGNRPKLDAVRCGFGGAAGAGSFQAEGPPGTDGVDVVLVDCYASYAGLDGFNYHQVCTALEINCKSDWCGWDTGLANNGSTLHETSQAIRIGGSYRNSQDRCIHDVHSSKSWNLGIEASTRRGQDATEQSAAFACGHPSATGGTLMWLDACRVSNGLGGQPQYPTECYNPSGGPILRYANLTFTPTAGPSSGTVQAYTP